MCEVSVMCVAAQVQPDLQQAVEFENEAAAEQLRNQLAAYCEVRTVEGEGER